jgi:hypothetical protein
MTAFAALTPEDARFRRFVHLGLLAAFVPGCIAFLFLMRLQAPGADFSPLWAGAKAALSDARKVYDFQYVTGLQGWPMGPTLRPFIYPPSALLVFAPLAVLPERLAYALWTLAGGGFFLWAGRRLGAPWWLLTFPAVWLVAYSGQVTFLVAALVLTALTLPKRPLVAGVLLGLAAAIKPQMAIFLPLALLAEGRWRVMLAAGVSALTLCAVSAGLWGLSAWTDWIAALGRFNNEVVFASPDLVEDMITPYAGLTSLGLPGAWAFALAPVAAWLVWTIVRTSDDPADRAIAVFGAALLVTPYAMHYEAALLAPSVAIYLARRDTRPWLLYAAVAAIFAIGPRPGPLAVIAVLSLPFIRMLADRREVARLAPATPQAR